jgi:hypothetical protein
MLRFKISLVLVIFCAVLTAQQPARKVVFAEAFGMGGIYSFSYEHHFSKGNWFLQPGFAAYGSDSRMLFIFPVMAKKAFGKGPHQLEAGIGHGFTLETGDGVSGFVRGLLLAGWRFQKPESSWIFRASYTPFISYLIDLQYQHWGGISIGYQLNRES